MRFFTTTRPQQHNKYYLYASENPNTEYLPKYWNEINVNEIPRLINEGMRFWYKEHEVLYHEYTRQGHYGMKIVDSKTEVEFRMLLGGDTFQVGNGYYMVVNYMSLNLGVKLDTGTVVKYSPECLVKLVKLEARVVQE